MCKMTILAKIAKTEFFKKKFTFFCKILKICRFAWADWSSSWSVLFKNWVSFCSFFKNACHHFRGAKIFTFFENFSKWRKFSNQKYFCSLFVTTFFTTFARQKSVFLPKKWSKIRSTFQKRVKKWNHFLTTFFQKNLYLFFSKFCNFCQKSSHFLSNFCSVGPRESATLGPNRFQKLFQFLKRKKMAKNQNLQKWTLFFDPFFLQKTEFFWLLGEKKWKKVVKKWPFFDHFLTPVFSPFCEMYTRFSPGCKKRRKKVDRI